MDVSRFTFSHPFRGERLNVAWTAETLASHPMTSRKPSLTGGAANRSTLRLADGEPLLRRPSGGNLSVVAACRFVA